MELRQTKFTLHCPENSSGHSQLGKTDSKTLHGFPSNLRGAQKAIFSEDPYPEDHFGGNLTSDVCAPEFHLIGARTRAPKQTRLGSIHLPGDARRTHVRRNRHSPFYDPKVEGRQVTWV
ncbi:hypothetical protein CRG98_008514 [Punica granatum]|uniref:Uncharacterized protein n=1 Tax=Punica granatum TaxID=22663 RepID=A0A2I0KRY2_PUNGR|nr:hypothetical protein CRG98_008514 [Punica granatum]